MVRALLDRAITDVNSLTPLTIFYEAIHKRRTGMTMAIEFDIGGMKARQ
jgi:hypothetical protein